MDILPFGRKFPPSVQQEDDWAMSIDPRDLAAQPLVQNALAGERDNTTSPTVDSEDDESMSTDDLDSDRLPSFAILEWTSPTQPPRTYTRIKGISESSPAGFILRCQIFRGSDTPHPELGDASDIYINGAAEKVFAKVETQDGHLSWVQWTSISLRLTHPLFPTYQLTAQRSLGIKWSTTNAIRIAKTRGHLAPTTKVAIKRTYDAFPELLSPMPKANRQRGGSQNNLNRPPSSVPEYSAPPSPSASPDAPDKSPVPDSEEEWHGFMDSADAVSWPLTPIPPPTQTLVQRLRDLPQSFLKRAGVEFPSYAKHIQWVSGIWTALPWYTAVGNRTNPDVQAVEHMSRAPDITLPADIRSEPADPRVNSFHNDPVLIVMEWTDELKGPISTGDEDLVGHAPEKIETHNRLYKAWLNDMQGHMSCGRSVAVRGWRPNTTTSWDVSSVSKLKGSTDQQIQYQDAKLRARSYHKENPGSMHVYTTLREFIEKGKNDLESCGNCLDSPSLRAEVPPFIVDIADCTRSLEITRSQVGAKLSLCADYIRSQSVDRWLQSSHRQPTPDTPRTCGRCRDIRDMMKASAEARGVDIDEDWVEHNQPEDHSDSDLPSRPLPRHHRCRPSDNSPLPEVQPSDAQKQQKKGFYAWVGHLWQAIKNAGPSVISFDAWKSCLWDLLTHACFLTYVHHDAAGYCTYAFVREGCKIWGIHRVKVQDDHLKRSDIYDTMRRILRPHGHLDYMEHTELYNFFLMKGDVLIQPPNTIHQVYTPVNSLASGGHFYNWHTLHLTELARLFDRDYSHTATNADHECGFRYLCRFAISLPTICTTRNFLRRPTLALFAMLLKPELYEPDFEDTVSRPQLAGFDLLRLEIMGDHVAALAIVKKVMAHYDLTYETIRDELDVGGVDWMKAGNETIDLSFLNPSQ